MSIESLVSAKFGPLQGVKIVSTGTLIAQPFAAELAAEMGAEVIQIERPGAGDVRSICPSREAAKFFSSSSRAPTSGWKVRGRVRTRSGISTTPRCGKSIRSS